MMLMKAVTMAQLPTAHAASRDEHLDQIHHANLLPLLRSIGENHITISPSLCSVPTCTPLVHVLEPVDGPLLSGDDNYTTNHSCVSNDASNGR